MAPDRNTSERPFPPAPRAGNFSGTPLPRPVPQASNPNLSRQLGGVPTSALDENSSDPAIAPRYDPLADLRGQDSPLEGTAADRPRRGAIIQRLAQHWPIWSLAILAAVTGVGAISAISLFRIPNLPNCRAIFWPTAAATTRVQCAEAYADQDTLEGYLEAIALLDSLPPDHPLRGDIDLRIEEWSERILDLAETTFQAGDITEAIAIVRRIPDHTAAAEAVSDRVNEWNQIWQEAETIYAAATADLTALAFQDAFAKAIQLLSVGNTHWETVKYDELTASITAAREDLNQLGRAKELARKRTLTAMEEAIALARGIDSQSPVYGEAQKVIQEFGRDLLAMAETELDRRDVVAARQMLDAIPASLSMGNEIADMRTLIDASQLSWQGGVTGLEGGVVRLQSIGADRPLYGKAQALMRRWQAEIQGRSQLEWARQVALPGSIPDLQAAIIEAQQISRSNPAWEDTAAQIGRWQDTIETTEDRPLLNQAQQQAQVGDLAGAIATARQIASGRALYDEAQQDIKQWRDSLQRAEDGPVLAQARQLAAQGRLGEAVAVASRIGSGRALSGEAQTSIQGWRSQLQGQQQLQAAYQTAQVGTVSALAEAVRLAQQVPESSAQRAEATQALTRWSWDILRLAETESAVNLNRAIEIAEAVPAQTEAYAQAQLNLREWRSRMPSSGAFN
ncbi:chromosome segregation ATPase [Nodosilinea sp. LEGE 07088]|uniref:chromosome segregation ATPase n=1 Tax=Nodosilinea sp. LEGE 07088 TaxID=2777968 RepID=UPI0018811905|nr:chromosome segregation ATPase [Nodosilinea sp. LEGE 07088]MBE9137342.1 chromosome segregation ATPase [Nodosilinea sp. LEGE 07088]